ncbi:MAG TPA: hypothetical protein VHO70_13405 [Chitinispirillaceae bacterium]|nr:hypothetical protein [Chitinispirillaceae bacterium]
MNNMKLDVSELNTGIKKIKALFSKEHTFDEGIQVFLEIHSWFYSSKLTGKKSTSFEDALFDGLTEKAARTAVNKKGRTVLYGVWHSTRIEDMTMNLLVAKKSQVYVRERFNDAIHAGLDHTGNSLSSDEILIMSAKIDIDALRAYRLRVGIESRKIIQSLEFRDIKIKVAMKDIERIRTEGGVDDVPAANWLLDFWSKKTVEGILMMPASRHHIVHFNENFAAKAAGVKNVR